MKEEYKKPEIELDEFEAVDVMTASQSGGYDDNDNPYNL